MSLIMPDLTTTALAESGVRQVANARNAVAQGNGGILSSQAGAILSTDPG